MAKRGPRRLCGEESPVARPAPVRLPSHAAVGEASIQPLLLVRRERLAPRTDHRQGGAARTADDSRDRRKGRRGRCDALRRRHAAGRSRDARHRLPRRSRQADGPRAVAPARDSYGRGRAALDAVVRDQRARPLFLRPDDRADVRADVSVRCGLRTGGAARGMGHRQAPRRAIAIRHVVVMVRIRVVTAAAGTEWSRVVDASSQARLAHAAEWFTVIPRAYGHEPLYLVADSDAGCAVLPAFVVRRPLVGAMVTSMPFLDSGGPCAASPTVAALLVERLITEARARRARLVELRSAERLAIDAQPLDGKVNMTLALD